MEHRDFWGEVFVINNGVTPDIMRRLCAFGFISAGIWYIGSHTSLVSPTQLAPYELIGAALAVLLMLRTNTGYDRWYEGRKLWGGIVNQSRNLAQVGLSYGPQDEAWRRQFVTWVAAFSHACRHSLRGDAQLEDMRELLGPREFAALCASQHKPLYVTQRLSELLQQALEDGQMDRFAFLQAEQQRCQLIDHIGACERILKTPLAKSLSVKIRRFLFLYLVALPFGIFDKVGAMTPLVVMLVAYPLLSLDQISVELQNPFSQNRVSHLPLNDICRTIQQNVFALLERDDAPERLELSLVEARAAI